MTVPRIVRPVKGCLTVHLPGGPLTEGNPNPARVAEMFGVGHVRRGAGGNLWSVPRARYAAVALNLIRGNGRTRGWGAVVLEQTGKLDGVWTHECLGAGRPVAECVCRCAGRYHGAGTPPDGVQVVGAGDPSPASGLYVVHIATPNAYLAHFGEWPDLLDTKPFRAVWRRSYGRDSQTDTY
jgi:hypothetical protein